MDNKDFLALEKKSVEHLRPYVDFEYFKGIFFDISVLNDFLMSLPLNDDCRRYIDEYAVRMSVYRSRMTPKEKAFEARVKVQLSDKFRALLYLCISVHEDKICEPIY